MVQKAIGLVKHQGAQVWCSHPAVGIGQEILQSARCCDEYVATSVPNFIQPSRLVRSTDRSLNDDSCISDDLSSFDSNLFCKFAGGRDDDGSNVRATCPASAAFEAWVFGDDILEDWKEERDGLACASSGLSDAIVEAMVSPMGQENEGSFICM